MSSEVAAVEIAQPWPSKATSVTLPSPSSFRKTCCSSPQNGLDVLELEVVLVEAPEVVRALVVLEDLIAVELVHHRLEDAADVEQRVDQAVDLVAGVVDGEARPGRGRHAEPLHQHLGAVVPGPYGDAVAVEDLGDVVGVDAVHREGDDSAAVVARGRSEDGQAGHLCDPFERVGR